MQLRKTPKKDLKIKKDPVVREEKPAGKVGIFSVFSQFLAVAGDFV